MNDDKPRSKCCDDEIDENGQCMNCGGDGNEDPLPEEDL